MDKLKLLSIKKGICVDCHKPVTLDALVKKGKEDCYHCVDCHSEDMFQDTYTEKPLHDLIVKAEKKENKIKKLVVWCFG